MSKINKRRIQIAVYRRQQERQRQVKEVEAILRLRDMEGRAR